MNWLRAKPSKLHELLDRDRNPVEVMHSASKLDVFYQEIIPGKAVVFVPFPVDNEVGMKATKALIESYSPCDLSIDGKTHTPQSFLREVEERLSNFRNSAWSIEKEDQLRIYYQTLTKENCGGLLQIAKSQYEDTMPKVLTLQEVAFLRSFSEGRYIQA
jgi:hypothetical protein